MLTKRENSTIRRFEYMKNVGAVMGEIVKCGFKDLSAVVAITQRYYPDTTRDDINDFWNFRAMKPEVLAKMENVLKSLKNE